jgi:hypothetical protein
MNMIPNVDMMVPNAGGGGGAGTLTINSTPIIGATGKMLWDDTGQLQEATIGSGLTFAAGTLSATAVAGNPSAPLTSVQFNNAGVFGGDSGFTYAGSGTATLSNLLNVPVVNGPSNFKINVSGTNRLDYGVTNGGAWTFTTNGPGTGQIVINTPTSPGHENTFLFQGVNTGSNNAIVVINNGDITNSGTHAEFEIFLNAAIGAANLNFNVAGGANPQASLTTGNACTSGFIMIIEAGEFNMNPLAGNITSNTPAGYGFRNLTTNTGGGSLINCLNVGSQSTTGTSAQLRAEILGGVSNVTLSADGGPTQTANLFANVGLTGGLNINAAAGLISIGNFIYGTGLTGTGSSISPGLIGIGIKAPAYPLDVGGAIGINGVAALYSTNANANWFGGEAGNSTAAGTYNAGFGQGALINLTSGSQNAGFGSFALNSVTVGNANVAIGFYAGHGIVGNENFCMGSFSGGSLTSGSGNIVGGVDSAVNLSAGSYNIALGGKISTGVGPTLTTGSQNIVLGADCDVASATANGQMSIGNIIYGTGNTNMGATPSTGWIGIGVRAAYGAETFGVNGTIMTNSAAFMIGSNTAYANGAAASAATFTNAPAAGNPTKWIPINDAGVTRYVPAF